MSNYECLFYETLSGRSPVESFVGSLDNELHDAFLHKKGLLEEYGPELRSPHTAPLKDGLFELRFKGNAGQRRVAFFFMKGKTIILVHGFVKKVQKTPKRDIDIALKRKKEYLARRQK